MRRRAILDEVTAILEAVILPGAAPRDLRNCSAAAKPTP